MLVIGFVLFLVVWVFCFVFFVINVFYIRSREDFYMFNSFILLFFFVGSLSFIVGNIIIGNE